MRILRFVALASVLSHFGVCEPTSDEVVSPSVLGEDAEKHEFQAEVSRLMDIIINSLYTHKEVFLRELISNCADALEKVRYLSLSDEEFMGVNKDLEIKISYDDDLKTLSIQDSGVGMTKADLINNLGTVAKSGTTNFLEAMSEGGPDASLIGQFGVGFYSAFLVADRIIVTSKNNNEEAQHIWESTADASFSIGVDPAGPTLGRGTRVTLALKEDAYEYLDHAKLKELTKRFSQFIAYPISILVPKEVDADVEDADDDEDDEDETEDGVEVKEDGEEDVSEKEKPTKKELVWEYEQINTQKAIWLRAKEDIEEEDYSLFYKAISHDYLDPLAHNHFVAEGEIEFRSILFVPKKAPFDMMDNYWTKKSEIKLYVRRVLVADKFDELFPRYLNFIRGVVDSDDLPLNVSREQLQQNKIMKVISKKLVRKALDMLRKLAQEEDDTDEDKEAEEKEEESEDGEKKKEESDFSKFYTEFAKNLKMGCYEDDSNRSKISKLLRFETTKTEEGKHISLDKYLENMKDGQEGIYYMSGDSMEIMKKHPSLQVFSKKDIEVIMLSDHLDEPCIQKLTDYEGKKFISIQKADIKLDETKVDKKRFAKIKDMYKPLTSWWKDTISTAADGDLKSTGIKIESVSISKRLVESPCVVVTSQFGYSAQQEKVMRAQAFQNKDQLNMMAGRKTLEINPDHPVIQDLLEKVNADSVSEDAKVTALILFQMAMIESGYDINDPTMLVDRVYRLMSKELGVNPDAPLKPVEIPDDEEDVDEESTDDDDDDDEETPSGEPAVDMEELLESQRGGAADEEL